MAGKNPGQDPLGHPPFSKVKLEGPKKHHDYHGDSASVPAKGDARAIPGEHWEKRYSSNFVHDEKGLAGSDWNPKLAKNRTCTHTKVNDEDH